MAQYSVRHGQNLFDIVLTCYGDLNGLGDFMKLNEGINYSTEFIDGQLVNYDETKVVSQVTANYYSKNRIIPTSGNSNIYYKNVNYPAMFIMYVNKEVVNLTIYMSGEGTIQIDWGDNSQMQTIELTEEIKLISHDSNSYISSLRKIRVYGNAELSFLDISRIPAEKIFTVNDFKCLELKINDNNILPNIKFVKIIKELNTVNFDNSKIYDLIPLISNMEIREIHLENCGITQSSIDEYVISLVMNYQSRLLAEVWISGNETPSGVYQAPVDLSKPQNGMEAIWVLENDVDRGWVFNLS